MESDQLTLLLVEDEPDLREALGEYFEACGFILQTAATAAEAMKLAQGNEPQLVVSDLSLPDLRGDRFLVDFHAKHPASKLFVHSGDSSYRPTPELAACGVTDAEVFYKPADLSEMVTRLHRR